MRAQAFVPVTCVSHSLKLLSVSEQSLKSGAYTVVHISVLSD